MRWGGRVRFEGGDVLWLADAWRDRVERGVWGSMLLLMILDARSVCYSLDCVCCFRIGSSRCSY
jgi:hypothetical protein